MERSAATWNPSRPSHGIAPHAFRHSAQSNKTSCFDSTDESIGNATGYQSSVVFQLHTDKRQRQQIKKAYLPAQQDWRRLLITRPTLMELSDQFKATEQVSSQHDINAMDKILHHLAENFSDILKHSPVFQTKCKPWNANLGKILHGCIQFSRWQSSPGYQGLNRFLSVVANEMAKPDSPQLGPQTIGNALYGLKNLTSSAGTEAVLQAIALHIPNAEQLSPQNIDNALYGLKHFKDSPAASRLLGELADHLSTLTTSHIAAFKEPAIFRAEVLNSLLPWLRTPSDSASYQTALDVLYALESHFHDASQAKALLKQPAGSLSFFNQEEIKAMVFHLLQGQVKKIAGVEVYDFHGLSHDLARTFGQTALERFMADDSQQSIRLIFGSSTHNPAKKEKMKDVARQVTALPGVSLQWKGPWVNVTKVDLI